MTKMFIQHDDSKLPESSQREALPDSPARFAHELANLLDGSLRNVGLALSTLRQDKLKLAGADDKLETRLEVANDAMQQMALLIRRWMREQHTPDRLHVQAQTLGETIQYAVRLLGPSARARQIQITVDLQPHVAALPAGPMYPIIANALRNSIEAIAQDRMQRPGRASGRICLVGRIYQGIVHLNIQDNGPGIDPVLLDEQGQFRFGLTTKEGGCGLGLSLCREIIQRLEGELNLGNPDEPDQYRGAELTVRFPAVKLQEFEL